MRSVEVDVFIDENASYYKDDPGYFKFTTMDMLSKSRVSLFNSNRQRKDHKLSKRDPISFVDHSSMSEKEDWEIWEEIEREIERESKRKKNSEMPCLYFEHPRVAFLFNTSDLYCRDIYSYVGAAEYVRLETNTKYRATLLCLYRDAHTMAMSDKKEEEATNSRW
jgi:hypothetical protein